MDKPNNVHGEINETINEFSNKLGVCMRDLQRIQNDLWKLKMKMDRGGK